MSSEGIRQSYPRHCLLSLLSTAVGLRDLGLRPWYHSNQEGASLLPLACLPLKFQRLVVILQFQRSELRQLFYPMRHPPQLVSAFATSFSYGALCAEVLAVRGLFDHL